MELSLEELNSLITQVDMIVKNEEVYLTCNQEEWALDLIYHHSKGRFEKISDKAINFLMQIASGKYKEVY